MLTASSAADTQEAGEYQEGATRFGNSTSRRRSAGTKIERGHLGHFAIGRWRSTRDLIDETEIVRTEEEKINGEIFVDGRKADKEVAAPEEIEVTGVPAGRGAGNAAERGYIRQEVGGEGDAVLAQQKIGGIVIRQRVPGDREPVEGEDIAVAEME